MLIFLKIHRILFFERAHLYIENTSMILLLDEFFKKRKSEGLTHFFKPMFFNWLHKSTRNLPNFNKKFSKFSKHLYYLTKTHAYVYR